jgi:hypothetical protein
MASDGWHQILVKKFSPYQLHGGHNNLSIKANNQFSIYHKIFYWSIKIVGDGEII